MNDPADDLVRRAQDGDAAAFGALLKRYEQGVYNLAYGVLGNLQEAQDAAQDVFLRVWRYLSSFRGDSAFTTWLYRVTVNTCLNRRRKLRPQLNQIDGDAVLAGLPAPTFDPLDATMRRQRQEYLWSLVDQLPEKYRVVILLFYREQLSYDEIAEVLALPLGTVKAHLNRARRALARRLREETERHHASL